MIDPAAIGAAKRIVAERDRLHEFAALVAKGLNIEEVCSIKIDDTNSELVARALLDAEKEIALLGDTYIGQSQNLLRQTVGDIDALQIRAEKAEAELAELRLAFKNATEADRIVKDSILRDLAGLRQGVRDATVDIDELGDDLDKFEQDAGNVWHCAEILREKTKPYMGEPE